MQLRNFHYMLILAKSVDKSAVFPPPYDLASVHLFACDDDVMYLFAAM